MGRPRLELHAILKAIPGVAQVYFQPPSGTRLVYPCIVYQRDLARTQFADNLPQILDTRYMITVMDQNPDSSIPHAVAKLPTSSFNRFYTAADLNHDVYTLYF